jgi:cytochrome P450
MDSNCLETAPWRENPPKDVFAELSDPGVQTRRLWSLCAWLREHEPVHRTEQGAVLLSRYRDAAQLMASEALVGPDPEHFAAGLRKALGGEPSPVLANNLGVANPPRHTRLRGLAAVGFTPRAVAAQEPSIRAAAEALLAGLRPRLLDGEAVDLHKEFGEPLTLEVISTMIGVPEADRPRLTELVHGILAFGNPTAGASGLRAANQATNTLGEYFAGLIEQRRKAPEDDLISVWCAPDGSASDRFSTDELVAMLWLLWIAGFETTTAALDNAIVAMIDYPAQADRLAGGGAQVRSFVEESLRFEPVALISSAHSVAGREIRLDSGAVVPEGTRAVALIAAANRDPGVYPDPDRFDADRAQPMALSFGKGIHTCLGAKLARTELEVALPLLRALLPPLALSAVPLRRGGLPLRTFSRLDVCAA